MITQENMQSIQDQDITNILSTFDPTKQYLKDKFIDAHDKQCWRVAIITDIEDERILIHYEAWGDRYNEMLELSDKRLAPFRSMTKGYTGQIRTPYRKFSYHTKVKEKYEEEIKELLEDPFAIDDAEKYTQYFRGELFFYVGSLMEILYIDKPDTVPVKEVLAFLKNYMKVLVTWMKGSFELKAEFEALEKYPKLYMVHSRTAVCAAYNEVLEMLREFFGGCKRTYNNLQYIYEKIIGKDEISRNEHLSKKALKYMLTQFYRDFKSVGGMEEIVKMLKTRYSVR